MRLSAFSGRTEGSGSRELNQENTQLWTNNVLIIHLVSLIQDSFEKSWMRLIIHLVHLIHYVSAKTNAG